MVHAVVRPKPVATTNAQNKIGQSTSTSTSGIKPKMKASDVLAGKKFDALEIKKSSTAETAPESPIGPMETKTTKASEFDNNPFGLREQAEQSNFKTRGVDYQPYQPLPSDEKVTLSQFPSQFQKACAE
uniref:Uncharacterized protein n=1 Tax=Chaetoceros debilis TaxID=122233 RepID=A0A6S8YWY8_9STRA|mmetsp:Transcript_24333/g.37210  ORF Transcript_24333/g.37210 Transcript_24333/m.37210 type:complete len:129 (-) Transcript_24333:1555-1941(-)